LQGLDLIVFIIIVKAVVQWYCNQKVVRASSQRYRRYYYNGSSQHFMPLNMAVFQQ